jgi:transcriptional regulator with XRE-family HTH domain
MDEFGKNLRYYRKLRRLTQTDLATQVGVAPAYVSQIESALRMPSLKVARKFADVLRVNLASLLGNPETPRTGDRMTDAEKLEALRGLLRSVEFDQEHRPERLDIEAYPGARGLRVSENEADAVRLYAFIEMTPGGAPGRLYSHPGRERVYCAAGVIYLRTGSEQTTLEPGDVREFESSQPHILWGERGSVAVSTTSPAVTPDNLRELAEEEDRSLGPAADEPKGPRNPARPAIEPLG